ncbi:MAG: dihydroorotate dehydrogenase [Sedimentisphaerales bacterium]|nr:dihydroorotate dehydrogenase [Sedimentisphaerales bacterium]
MNADNDKKQVDLSVNIGKVRLANPVMTASGTCGYAYELRDFVDLGRLGAFVTKSITREERVGNAPQRTVETASGLLNAIGLANMGLDKFIEGPLALLARMSVPVFVNVAGKTVDDYIAVAEALAGRDEIAGLEINVSCPNVKEGGITFGTDPKILADLVGRVRQVAANKVLIAKLTPNVTDITVTARAAIDAGADALSLINTLTGMVVDVERRRPVLANRTGGLSGPAIKPVAVHMVERVYREVAGPAKVPIIGLGGIACALDALEFIIAGASAVGVGTAVLTNPPALIEVIEGIEAYLARHGMSSVAELVGSLQ